MLRKIRNSGLTLIAIVFVFSGPSRAQSPQSSSGSSPQRANDKVIVVSEKTSTARIAAPNELIGVNGHVMRVDEFMAFLSASTSLVQRLHNLEKQNSSDSPQVVPESKMHSDSRLPAAAPAAGSAPPPVAAPEKH